MTYSSPMDQKRITGMLMTGAGFLLLLASVVQRFQQPVWTAIGVVFVALGVRVLRRNPGG